MFDAVMVSKKTDPLFLGRRPEHPAPGRRNTDLMGLPPIEEPSFRDTIKDPFGPMESMLPETARPAEPPTAATPAAPSFGPRPAPIPRGGTMPVSSKIEAMEASVPTAARPLPVGGKVDLSRADPRRAPTQRVAKRPNELMEPDWSVAHRPPPFRPAPPPPASNLFAYALAIFGVLAFVLVALVLYLKVLR
jgi:hypothetical protein